MKTARQEFYSPEALCRAVIQKLEQVGDPEKGVDFLTFVPDGEPTLDIHLGLEIQRLHGTGHKVGVISNASLLWRDDVRADLRTADWVSLKVDAVQEDVWRKINRPHKQLSLHNILAGMQIFANEYTGTLVTETMLVHQVNDQTASLAATADFLTKLHPAKAYISIPTRPPCEPWVLPPGESALNLAYQIFSKKHLSAEFLIQYEGDSFIRTGDAAEDLLSIVAVHPMREDAVFTFIEKAGAAETIIDELISDGNLRKVEYQGRNFYVRCFSKP